MSNAAHDPSLPVGDLPEGSEIVANIARRNARGNIWRTLFLSALLVGLLALVTLGLTIVNSAFGSVAVVQAVNPATLADRPLEDLNAEELTTIFRENVSPGLFRRYDREKLFTERAPADILALIEERVTRREALGSYSLIETLTRRDAIIAELAAQNPDAVLESRSWLSGQFLQRTMASSPEVAGIRTAILGSLLVILLTMTFALPVGIGAAIYLEEYAAKNRLNRFIETNINNLAGVPSIIYGLLGLAVFVRALEPLTSGAVFGVTGQNGRTVISAALTMALLILPLLIINAREAIRAVPLSIRQASYGLGATRWQTVWNHVLPQALPGILTGTILGMSRAIGETAPLIVIGASTFIVSDPTGPFSKFTVLPIQIYNWTQQPSDLYRNAAAAAIIVLLIMLLSLNALAIVLRNRFRRSL